MLGPHSRSEIDFLEKKVRKSRKRNNPPPCLATAVIYAKTAKYLIFGSEMVVKNEFFLKIFFHEK